MGLEELVFRYLTPTFIVAYAIRIEVALRAIHSNRDIRELIHYMKWMAEAQTGKVPPPYVEKN
jgi:hypothetical protein